MERRGVRWGAVLGVEEGIFSESRMEWSAGSRVLSWANLGLSDVPFSPLACLPLLSSGEAPLGNDTFYSQMQLNSTKRMEGLASDQKRPVGMKE